MNAPLPYEKQEPECAEFLATLYRNEFVFRAYIWRRGFRSGVAAHPFLPLDREPLVLNRGSRIAMPSDFVRLLQ